ncbi:MAG: hypothetical protein QF701_10820, partial [Nitrospinota bacterium]|nr:hypothetical protein [Nitrospinota bacterium]
SREALMPMKKPVRQRGGQQWISDYLLKTTGRAVHHEGDGWNLPPLAGGIPGGRSQKTLINKTGKGCSSRTDSIPIPMRTPCLI